jgi:hypothetical protein
MRVKLTPAFCQNAAAAPGAERTIYWDTVLRGFGLVVVNSGHRGFCVQYRHRGRSRRMTIKAVLGLDQARRRARELLGDVARDRDPLAEKRARATAGKNTLRAIAEQFLQREGRKLRTIKHRRADLERLIYPRLGSRPIAEIRRSEIVRLLDSIEDDKGAARADKAFMILRRLFSWHAGRSDEFRSPIVRGMWKPAEVQESRTRILTDDELRTIWRAAESRNDVFSFLVRFLLLTAARRNEAARMNRSEIVGADWTIPAARYKTKVDFLIPLSSKAQELLDAMPVIGHAGWVFTSNGKTPIAGFTQFKQAFDEACGVKGWRIHDLRRTARSLMSRAGVDADHAERCLGHVIGGMRGVYDRHQYRDEKLRGFEALAAQIERIVDQPRVTPLRQAAAL